MERAELDHLGGLTKDLEVTSPELVPRHVPFVNAKCEKLHEP